MHRAEPQLPQDDAFRRITRRRRRFALQLVFVTGALVGCSGDDAAPAPSAQPPAASPSPTSSVSSEATAAVDQFLTALVSEDHDAAYALLSPAAQATLPLDAFAAAREAKNAGARSLSRRYELTDAQGDSTRVVVTGTGRLADGTPASLSLPVVATEQGWRVDAVPTTF